IALGYSPAPGLARRFLRDEILAKILSAGFSTDDLRLPEAILVRRASQKLDRRQVERAVTDAFARQYPSARIEISYVDIPDIQVGTGNLDFLATISPHSDPSGPVYVKLDIRGSNPRTVNVRAQARIEMEQPVIIRPISAQSRISSNDVQWQLVPLRSNRDVLTSLDAVEGMVAKRDLAPGTILST